MEVQVARRPVTGIELITCTGAPTPVTLGIHARPCAFDHLRTSVSTVCNLDNSSQGDLAFWNVRLIASCNRSPKGHTPTLWSSFVKQAAPYPSPMTPKPVALVQLAVQKKLMAPKPVALRPASLLPLVALSPLPVCAFFWGGQLAGDEDETQLYHRSPCECPAHFHQVRGSRLPQH